MRAVTLRLAELVGLAVAWTAFVSCAGDAVLVETSAPPPPGPCAVPQNNVPDGECDVYAQDCASPEVCMVVFEQGDYRRQCVGPRAGNGPGATCQGNSECARPLVCITGRCGEPCCTETQAPCAPNGLCIGVYLYGPYAGVYCSHVEECALFVSGECDQVVPPSSCHLLSVSNGTYCIEDAAQSVAEGELCDFINECGDNQICWPPNQLGSRCRYACYLDAPGSEPNAGGCPSGQMCADFGIGVANVGVCTP
jgi:hypothetical protein